MRDEEAKRVNDIFGLKQGRFMRDEKVSDNVRVYFHNFFSNIFRFIDFIFKRDYE